MPSRAVCDEPTRSITAQAPPLVAAMICCDGIGRAAVDHACRAGLLRRVALGRIDIDDDRALAAHRLVQREAHQAEPAGADDRPSARPVSVGPTFFSAP